MPFTLPDLPFAKEALAPHMSAETLDFHHGKHHQAYVDKLNELVAQTDLAEAPLTEVIRACQREGRQQAVQQCRPALEPQLLLAMPGRARGPAADGQAGGDDRGGIRQHRAAADAG